MFQSLDSVQIDPNGFFPLSLFQSCSLLVHAESFDEIFHEVLEQVSRECGKSVHRIEEEAAEIFETYAWPGGFEELREVLRFAVKKMRKEVLKAHDLPLSFLRKVYGA